MLVQSVTETNWSTKYHYPTRYGEPLLKQSSSYSFPVCKDSACCLVCKWRRDSSALRQVPIWYLATDVFVRVIMSYPYGQIDRSVQYIRKSLIYSMRKAFLEKQWQSHSINWTRSPTANVWKGESIAKVRFKFFLVHKHIYIHIVHSIQTFLSTNQRVR